MVRILRFSEVSAMIFLQSISSGKLNCANLEILRSPRCSLFAWQACQLECLFVQISEFSKSQRFRLFQEYFKSKADFFELLPINLCSCCHKLGTHLCTHMKQYIRVSAQNTEWVCVRNEHGKKQPNFSREAKTAILWRQLCAKYIMDIQKSSVF